LDEKKEELLQLLNCHFAELLSLTRAVNAVKSRQVETAKLKSQADLAPKFYPVLSSPWLLDLPGWAAMATGAGAEPSA